MIRCQNLTWGAPGQPLTPALDVAMAKGSLTALLEPTVAAKAACLKSLQGCKNHLPAKSCWMFHGVATWRICRNSSLWIGNSPSVCKRWWPQVSGARSKQRSNEVLG